MKLFDAEHKVMDVLWRDGDTPARKIADALTAQVGWNVNTTYTVIKRCIGKGAIERRDPGFLCHALLRREEVYREEAEELLDRLFGGSIGLLVASLVGTQKLTKEEKERLRALIDEPQ